jgi:hypothetical protein
MNPKGEPLPELEEPDLLPDLLRGGGEVNGDREPDMLLDRERPEDDDDGVLHSPE